MKLKIKKVNKDNFKIVTSLKVSENQKGNIEENAYSIAESKYYKFWVPVALYDENTIVGFGMYGQEENRVWLDRYMIDKNYQGKGYGKAFLRELIRHIKEIYGCTEIYLSVFESNKGAIDLYENYGFVFNGELDYDGELVMIKTLK